jgi:hypothetical protein
MKRSMLVLAACLATAGGLAACGSDNEPQSAEPIAVDAQEIVTAPLGPLMWPTAPISWVDGVGTWPIAIWSSTPLNWMAFDIPGVMDLDVSFTTIDGALLGANLATIDAALLNTVTTGPWLGGLWPAYGMLPWMNGLGDYPFYGAPGYVYGLDYYPYVAGAGCPGCVGAPFTPLIDGLAYTGLYPAGLTPLATTAGLAASTALLPGVGFMNPMLTANALMCNSIPFVAGATAAPIIANLTFSGLQASQMASLNIFAANTTAQLAATNAAIQATVFPIMGVPFL